MISLGCATTRDLTSPDYSINGWMECEVGGIRVLTNADSDVARRSLRKLARFLVLAGGVGGHALPNEPITLHFFDRMAQYQGFVGAGTAGHAIPTADGYFIAMGGDHPEWTTEILFHEIAHLLLFETGDPLPAWYHEGYAEYLASAIMRPGVGTLGRPLPGWVATLRSNEPFGLLRLFRTRHASALSPGDVERYYAEAWAFVHFTQVSVQSGKRAPQLARFLELLGSGKAPGAAFATAFGATLGRVERRYLLHRQQLVEGDEVLYRHYLFEAEESAIEFRRASPDAVARDLAAHALALERYDVALRHYGEVLDRNPRDTDALLGRAVVLASAGDFEEAEHVVAEIPPDQPRAEEGRGEIAMRRYQKLEASTGEGEEAQALLAEAFTHFVAATRRDPTCARCWDRIAVFHARHPRGDPTAGLEAVDRAGPLSRRHLVRGELLLRLGRYEDASDYVDRLVNTTHDPSIAAEGRKLLLRIVQEQRAAREAADPALSF
jgi:tetratricopeptide (TPR) repeat protein